MKTKHNILNKISLSSGLAVALAIAAWLPASASAAEQVKGGERQLNLLGIKTQAQAEALKPGDAIAMICTKCKSVTVTYVTQDSKWKTRMIPGEKHRCPGCNSTIEVVGAGKGKHDELKHVCKACGDDSAFCCATKPGAGATKGMEKEKK